jgi:hypothetical protein
MALNVTVQSYNGRLDYGLIACRRAVPDVNDLADALLAEHRKLLELALAQAPVAVATPVPLETAKPPARKARTAVAAIPAKPASRAKPAVPAKPTKPVLRLAPAAPRPARKKARSVRVAA